MELICRRDAYATSTEATVTAVDERGVTLDRTVFYATGGGQPGDTGVLRYDGVEVRLIDAIKGDGPDTLIHVPEPGAELPAVGSTVEVEIDWDRRFAHMRMHPCLHLLCAVVPGAVTGTAGLLAIVFGLTVVKALNLGDIRQMEDFDHVVRQEGAAVEEAS